ncbi:MAG: protein-L-isoaspartate O-methyltransferase, partial [Mesorhizobium sp.]
MNLNHGPTGDDREGFAAFLLRLRGKGVVPKALIAA